MQSGTIKWYDTEKGLGFVAVHGQNDVLVTADSFADQPQPLADGDWVEFDVHDGKYGPEAIKLTLKSA
ncbi:hypothetical protein IV38_GL000255 [Lactobacillus selangorensis]|uniref:CSD domain-containing protein n=1 Tax=Lactobacillus selangorensis TaxID=81857 RepID=A0A0R2GB98_9LACO|nr:cold shock domain-containing protein [Lactobacillus selangorensis]KRN29371.1 hypothetical protein IV38_GL000255 [Lactobacillus selangorensis]KRN34100.1 hypothetical protein IV40_GL000414 [Lactobacillus selangorensis]